jgi:hypothetical protein
MSTLTSQEPDITDLNIFFENYAKAFGIAIYEENPDEVKIVSSEFKPISCILKATRHNKVTHFLQAPPVTAKITCLCGAYHTQFISQKNKIYNNI